MKRVPYTKLLLPWLCGLVLTGCAATTGSVRSDLNREALQQQLLTLPGAVVDLNSMTVAYPGDVLYAPGAALPLPGGLEVLDPLISWMLKTDGIYGEARVRSSGYAVDYDRVLAEKRRELLERLFLNRGLNAQRLHLMVDESAGAPLEIRFQLRSSATSAGEKS